MKTKEINIDEENTNLIWGLVAIVAIAGATYMLTNAFMAGSWELATYTQLISLALFILGFYGIIRISTPLFHFVLRVTDDQLKIEIWQEGDQPVDVQLIPLQQIKELRIAPHTPRAANDALFDFSSSYYLLYRLTSTASFKRLIDLEGKAFTLKVEDIKKIINFISGHNPAIDVPDNDAVFVELKKPLDTNF